ncbi:MAG: hypothetical protein B7Y99_06700 [Caulobacterales bacterium 32-69-10]|nr:MAG: hypothetical protein B7Y99_06700 [Caulobacterales bacterium 32-69-10]
MLLLAALVLCSGPALAAAPLTLGEVLDSSRRHAPQVLEAIARARSASGRALAAEGAFDTLFSVETKARTGGPYDGRFVDTTLSPLGEVKVGALFSLLRDRAIDERRFNRTNARLEVEVAEMERLMVAIGVQRRALAAYNAWVVSGMRLKIYQDLLDLARERQAGFVRQVDLGSRPRILLTESEQAILRRQILVTRAEQELSNAATTLSFFLRSEDGSPLRPGPERLPGALTAAAVDPAEARINRSRPDLRLIDVRISQASRRLELDRNSLLPRLDLRVEASQDLGGSLPSGLSPRNTELTVGLRLGVPLQQRTAAGRIASSQAEIEAARRRRQALEDQISIDLQRLSNDVQATADIQRLAEEERDRATTMAAAERRRFEIGASDFFLVNLREEAAADADVRRLEAAYRQIEARAELAAAAMDLPALGLDPGRRL